MFNDNGSIHQAIPIDPFNITNLFVNYTLRGSSKLSQSRIRLAVNNLTDSHAITAVTPASTKSNAPAPGDILTLMAGRSVSVSFTVGFSPGNALASAGQTGFARGLPESARAVALAQFSRGGRSADPRRTKSSSSSRRTRTTASRGRRFRAAPTSTRTSSTRR